MPAPQYIQLLFDWIDEQMADDTIFPKHDDMEFPENFVKICQKIFTRLFRVIVHIYFNHFKGLEEQKAEVHVNTFLLHFYFFVTEFDLVKKREFEPLQPTIDNLLQF